MDLTEGEKIEEDEEPIQVEEDFKTDFNFKLIKQPSGGQYAVSFFHPDYNLRKKWSYYNHCSAALQNLEQKAEISRHNWWRIVY